MGSFLTLWLGQTVSVVGSTLTSFVLGVWVYRQTGSVTQYSLILLASSLPGIVLSPIAGALVDRWNRRRVLILSDAGSAVVALILALAFFSGRLAVWHLYPLLAAASLLRAVQVPAYSAGITLLVPKQQLARAGGLVQMSQAISLAVGPPLAALLLGVVDIGWIILADVASFLCALLTLAAVHIPSPAAGSAGAGRSSLLREAAQGWTYIRERSGLMTLLLFFAVVNFSVAIVQALITPLVLSFGTAADLGIVLSVGSVGMFLGSFAMSTWGGPGQKVTGILGFGILLGASLMAAGLRPSTALLAGSFFFCLLSIPFINSLTQAIWQVKTPPALQGRVFAVRAMIAWSCMPIGYLLAGPLADRVFEPLLRPDGGLAASLGRVVGTGPGRGIAALLLLTGCLPAIAALGSSLSPSLRRLEESLPDQVAEQNTA